jgi:hypothetical protein
VYIYTVYLFYTQVQTQCLMLLAESLHQLIQPPIPPRPAHRVTQDQGDRTCARSPTLFIGLGFHHISFSPPQILSTARSPLPLLFCHRSGFIVEQRHISTTTTRFHGGGLVEGGRFHDDDTDPGDGSIEGGWFHSDDLDPTNTWVHRAIPRDALRHRRWVAMGNEIGRRTGLY